jgi:anti-sigma factor RsiW
MNPDDERAHREAQEVLPWLANGSLAGAELERVQAHLHACADCRADLALLHTLRAAGRRRCPGWTPNARWRACVPCSRRARKRPMTVSGCAAPSPCNAA